MKKLGQMPSNDREYLERWENQQLFQILKHTLACFDTFKVTTAQHALEILMRRDKNSEVCSHGAARVAAECKLLAAGSWPG